MEESYGLKGLVLFFIFGLAACTPLPTVTFDSGASFTVELADTPEEQAKGLMYRNSLTEDKGMLFMFDDQQPRSFWMKNTFIPLDMIFINSKSEVVKIQRAVPCKQEPCMLYKSPSTQYVLEINAGLAEQNNIVVGSKMLLS